MLVRRHDDVVLPIVISTRVQEERIGVRHGIVSMKLANFCGGSWSVVVGDQFYGITFIEVC
jgi:hypothetical protein